MPSESQSVSEEEPEVQESISPSVDLRFANSRAVGDTYLSGLLLAEVSAGSDFEFL